MTSSTSVSTVTSRLPGSFGNRTSPVNLPVHAETSNEARVVFIDEPGSAVSGAPMATTRPDLQYLCSDQSCHLYNTFLSTRIKERVGKKKGACRLWNWIVLR